jgi:hypothetical protein
MGRPIPSELATLIVAFIVIVVATCGGTSARSPADGAAAASEVPITDEPSVEDAPCRLEALPNTPICCGKPGERVGNNCYDRALIEMNLANCAPEGSGIDARFQSFGERCCDGLKWVEAFQPTDGGGDPNLSAGCRSFAPGSLKICARCGNEVCGPGENRCNCPADCR